MKIINLRKKIITNSIICASLSLILAMVFFYDSYNKQMIEKDVQKIQSEINSIKQRTIDLQNKVSEAKKYQDIWKTISNNKKFIGSIKIDEVTSRIDALAEKYSIEKPAIKMTIPEDLPTGVFNRQTVNINVSNSTITFDAVNDTKAIAFVSEFAESVPGYIVITNFELRKTKKYNEQDLISISTGKPSGAVSAKVDFFWYMYKAKNAPQASTTKPTQPIQESE